ncbi:hypothetical protein FQN49_006825 [Arthroderma sp. PD_2]|nr:hypothetical protein FQN49_006825 [Arthroderma sp. PD_2]
MAGDVDIFTIDGGHGVLQFEGVHIAPLAKPTAADDQMPFSEIVWGPLDPSADAPHTPISAEWVSNLEDLEHFVFLAVKDVASQITPADLENLDWHRSRVAAWLDRVMAITRDGKHCFYRKEWLDETDEDRIRLSQYVQPVLLEVMEAARCNLVGFLRGQTSMLEVLRENDLLTRFYKEEEELRYMNGRLGGMVAQIAFRYPRMKILEIGAGTGSATHAVLDRIGRSYHSFTFSDISAGFFEDAQATLMDHNDRLIYKVLDIEQDPMKQGFEEHSYDLIIAANVLHATRYLESTMTNVRRLLKPGGYLAALEVTNKDGMRDTFIMGGFEGWWLGESDGRAWGPMLSPPEWDNILQKSEFNGFTAITPSCDSPLAAYSVFVSQAVDHQVQLLREPLMPSASFAEGSMPSRLPDMYDSLMILGGATERTSHLISELRKNLMPYFCQIIHIPTLDCLEFEASSLPAVLSLSDIDSPCFQELTDSKLNALKRLVEVSQKLLWVTAGPENENPYMSMSRGFLNCIGYEQRLSIYQNLNIVDLSAATGHFLAENLMRLVRTDFDNDYSLKSHVNGMWLELRFEDGMMKIPRIVREPSSNRRYAARRREVRREVDLNQSTVKVITSPSGRNELVNDGNQLIDGDKPNGSSSRIAIRVRYTTSLAVRMGDAGFLTVVIGRNAETHVRVVALSDEHASVVSVNPSWCWEVPHDITENEEAAYLKATASALIAIYLVQHVEPDTAILVHEADDIVCRAIWIKAISKGIRAHFSTTKQNPFNEPIHYDTLFIHERIPTRALSQLLPRNISTAVDLGLSTSGIFTKIESHLPQDARRYDIKGLYRAAPLLSPRNNDQDVAAILKLARSMATQVMERRETINTIDVQQLPGRRPSESCGLEIVDWASTSELSVKVHPASSMVKLSAQKSYLLVGMAGDLGKSVCHWMVTKGARSIVLTSRTAKVDAEWTQQMLKLGAEVVTLPMDVTDRNSILNVDRYIQQHLPPVGGVVNGAMILRDQMFMDSSLETINSQFRPKVDGSLLLEEIYGNKNLEFFILFGSAAAVIGNVGQSAYTAATNFMTNLVQGRRKRNLVGSIIHPGQIMGVGYVARMGKGLLQLMSTTVGEHIVSEHSLHELFAEAILAGHPQSGRNPEIIAGLSMESPAEKPDILWYRIPKAWPLVDYFMHSNSAGSMDELVPLQEQLESATTRLEALEIVTVGLSAKLHHRLHLPEDVSITADTRVSELGVDSLVAVDLRTWFSKDLAVDIPVLQILNGSSIGELASSATEKLPVSLLPSLIEDKCEAGAEKSEKSAVGMSVEELKSKLKSRQENGAVVV